jgi:hypothetical protein
MSKRGTIMRDPSAGPGLVMVQGQQYQFALEGIWRSETLPKPGLVVDVDFDPAGQVIAMTPVPESRLAKEQADAALEFARTRGTALASGLVARFGAPRLVAAGLLLVGWFFLSTVSVDAAILGKLKVTFWQVLGLLNADSPMEMLAGGRGGPSAGLYGLAAVVCLAGPFLAHFWKDGRAHLGGVLPLVFMVVVALLIRHALYSALGAAGNAAGFGGGAEYESMFADMQRQAKAEAMKAVSIGAGAYLSVLASLYFAVVGVKGFLVRRAGDRALIQE